MNTSDTDVSKEALQLIISWYESYSNTIILITTVSTSVLIFSVTFLLKDALDKKRLESAVRPNIRLLIFSWGFLVCSSLSGILAYLAVYKWYAAALGSFFSKYRSGILPDKFQYTDPGTMEFWGQLSATLGWMAGIPLLLGLGLIIVASIKIIRKLYTTN